MSETLTTREVADQLKTDPKTLRKFLRDTLQKDALPGQGGRYGFTATEVKKLQAQFTTWVETKAQRKAAEAEEGTDAVEGTITVEVVDTKPAKKARKGKKVEPEPEPEELVDIEDEDFEDIDDEMLEV